MYFDFNWQNKNPLLNPMTDDWFIWSPQAQGTSNWDVCIKCYINMAEITATNLRNNIGSDNNLYNILGFLFCVRQSIELSLKKLCKIKGISIKENHDLKESYKEIKESYNWENYGIVEDNFVSALDFMQDKNEIFRYPYDKKNKNYEAVAIHLSDWLSLIHTLYHIVTEEQEGRE